MTISPAAAGGATKVSHDGTAELVRINRRERRVTAAVWLGRLLVVIVPLALWSVLTERGVLPSFIFSRPGDVFSQVTEWLVDGTIVANASFTLMNAAIGYVLGLTIGAGAAAAFTTWPRVGAVLMPFVTMVNAVPRIAFAPLLVAWFGFGLASNISLVVLVVVFVNFFTVFGGLQSIDSDQILWSQALGASQWQVWRSVRFPAIIRWVLSGMRISIGLALSASIVSEFIGGARGIGYLVASSTNVFQSAGVYAGITVTILVAGLVDAGLRKMEKKWAHWVGQS